MTSDLEFESQAGIELPFLGFKGSLGPSASQGIGECWISAPLPPPRQVGQFRTHGLRSIPATWVTLSLRRGSRSVRANMSRVERPSELGRVLINLSGVDHDARPSGRPGGASCGREQVQQIPCGWRVVLKRGIWPGRQVAELVRELPIKRERAEFRYPQLAALVPWAGTKS